MGRVRLEVFPALAESLGIAGNSEEVIPDDKGKVGRTVKDLFNRLAGRHRRFGRTVFAVDEQKLTGRVVIFLNGRSLEPVNGLNTELSDGDTLTFVPVIEGG
jgi:molybdopterin converting factor small subunit